MANTSEILFDNGNVVARWESNGSKVLAVVFGPMHVLGTDKPGFAEEFLRKNGVDVVAVQRNEESWYQDLSRRQFTDFMKPIRKRYNRVVLYGTSLGGYAALYFARDEHVLAFSPRIPIHPDYRQYFHKGLNDEAFVHDPLGYTPNATVIYDPLNGIDRKLVEHEVRAPKEALFPVPFVGHSAITYLSEAKILARVALDFIKRGKRPDMKELRSVRRLSPKAHVHFADICEARKHTSWSALAIAYGLDRWPSDKELLARAKKFRIDLDPDPPPTGEQHIEQPSPA